jgi:heptaprenyl diphosphate synthase
MTSREIAKYAIFAVLAMMASYIESLFPLPVPVPGIKLGLANLVVVIVLYRFSAETAWFVNLLRIMMTGILFQGMFGLLYSLAGGIVSLTVMILCKKTGRFSVIGVSLAGGAAHNLAQLAVALTAVSGWALFRYFPFLLFSGMAAGILVGTGAWIILGRLPDFIRGGPSS